MPTGEWVMRREGGGWVLTSIFGGRGFTEQVEGHRETANAKTDQGPCDEEEGKGRGEGAGDGEDEHQNA